MVITREHHLLPSWSRWIQSVTYHPTSLRSILNYLLNYTQVLEVFPFLQVSQPKPECMYLLPARKLTHTYGLRNITERAKTLESSKKAWGVSFLAKFDKHEINIYTLKVFCSGSGMGNRDGRVLRKNSFVSKKYTNIFRTMRSIDKCPPKWASFSSVRGRISKENQFHPKNYTKGFRKQWQVLTDINHNK